MAEVGRLSVNLYREGERIMIAAPLPGLEPSNIRCQVDGRRLAIVADMRGPGQERTQEYLIHEWTVGPCQRTIDLPDWVDPVKANASYDNGVLVIILPVAPGPVTGSVTMLKVGTAKGQRVGHVGKDHHVPR